MNILYTLNIITTKYYEENFGLFFCANTEIQWKRTQVFVYIYICIYNFIYKKNGIFLIGLYLSFMETLCIISK